LAKLEDRTVDLFKGFGICQEADAGLGFRVKGVGFRQIGLAIVEDTRALCFGRKLYSFIHARIYIPETDSAEQR
jgi:hypothetical protein